MESILNEIDEGLRKQLAEHSMKQIKLKKLDSLLVGHENHVLTTYIFWLLKGVITDSTLQDQTTKYFLRDSQLQSWCDRLQRNYKIETERIFDTLCIWTKHLIAEDTVNRLHLQKIEGDIQVLLFHGRSRKPRKLNRIRIAVDQAPAALQGSYAQALKIDDNEEYLKATMHSTPKEFDSLDKPELIEVSSGSDSEVEIVGSYQVTYRHHPHSTTQLPSIAPMQSNSCQSLDRSSPGDDATSHPKEHVQSTPVQAPKRRQEIELKGGPAGKQKDMGWTTIEQDLPGSQAEAPPAQNSHRDRIYVKKKAKPHAEYLCYRCEVPGHFLQDCPTNLDPAFDRIPVGGYKCMICGKTKAHLTALCPDNTDPKSLTQLRLTLGTTTARKSQEKNDHRSIHGKSDSSTKYQRSLVVDTPGNGFMNEDRRRAMLEPDQDCDDQLPDQDTFESRYMQAKRAYSRRKSIQDDPCASRHASPPSKRFRHDDRKQNSDRERERARERSNATRNKEPYMEPSELLASLDSHRAERGRLSYWDSEDQLLSSPNEDSPPKYRGFALSSSPTPTKMQPLAQAFWSKDERLEEIKCLFPYADPDWVHDMADFDIDKFFEELDDFELPTTSDAKTSASIMELF